MKSAVARFSKRNLLINRNFALLWSGSLISTAGDLIFGTTLILWIATQLTRGQSWGPLAVGGIALSAAIPSFLVGPIAGVLADRWDRRQTMLRMDALRAILIALLLLATNVIPLPFVAAGRLTIFWQLGAIYLVNLLASACGQFFDLSNLALVGSIIDESDRTRASVRLQVLRNFAAIVCPPLAALLFFSIGAQLAILLNALSFVVSFLALLAIRVPKAVESEELGQQANFLREFSEGIRFFIGNRVLMTLLTTIVIILLGEDAFLSLGVFFVTQNLHASASLYAFLDTASAVGLVVGAVFSNAVVRRLGAARMFWLSLAVSGGVIIVYARMTSFIPALVAMFVYGILVALQNMTIMPLIMHVTPQKIMGRAMSVFGPVTNLASLLAVTLVSSLATALHGFHATLLGISFGTLDTIFLAAGVIITISGFYAMVMMRGVTLPSEGKTKSAEQTSTVEAT